MRISLAIPPGVLRDGTEGQSRGRWMRSSLVRGYGDDIGPVQGWRPRSASTVSGKARAIIAWSTEGAERRIGIGTHTGLYIQTAAGAVHDITPSGFTAGEADATVNVGFGGGVYGADEYGTPRPDTGSPMPASVWLLDTWGQYLVGCLASDGRLLQWENDTGTDAAAITNAPTSCQGVLTTQERFTVALGASGNPRLVAWSDRADNEVWTPSTTNLAGDFELDSQGGIVTGLEIRGATLILTDADAHTMVYVGLPSVYLLNRIGEACGAVSVRCIATQGDFAMWWSKSGFKRFDGALQSIECPIDDIFAGANAAQLSKVTAWHNASHTEFKWCYPSANSTENDRYISFNYQTGEWWEGELVRLSGAGQGAFDFPLLMGDDGLVYEHEVPGLTWDGATPFALSGPIFLGDGAQTMRVGEGDFDVAGDVSVGFDVRDYATSPATTIAPTALAPGKTDLRFTGRRVEINVEFASPDGRFGKSFLEAKPAGRR